MNCATCRSVMPVKKAPANPSGFCSYWCSLVGVGKLTFEQITPWLASNRGAK